MVKGILLSMDKAAQHRFLLLLILPVLALAMAGSPRVHAVSDSEEVQLLRQQLKERAAQVQKLEQRVEALEKQVAPTPDNGRERKAGEKKAQAPAKPSSKASGATEPGRLEVDETAAERALERTLVAGGALLLPVGQAEVTPRFSYTRIDLNTPVVVTADGQSSIGIADIRQNELLADLSLQFGLPFDTQLEIGLPYRYVERQQVNSVIFEPRSETTRDGSGLGDVRVGLAKGLLQEARWWPDLIARVTWDTGTGEETDNGVALGGGFSGITGSLTATKRQDPLAFFGAIAYSGKFEKDGLQPGDELQFTLGTVLAASPETSLSLGLDQSFIGERKVSGRTVEGSNLTQSVLTIGAATILGKRTLLNLAVGIGLTDESEDYSIRLSLPIRFGIPFQYLHQS